MMNQDYLSLFLSTKEKGHFIEANQRFEYAMSKAIFGENLEQIRNRLQEGLHLCKIKMKKEEGQENDDGKVTKLRTDGILTDATNIFSIPSFYK
ncbi:protein TANC2 [Caerostris darwini]|uniref:Protein TANC2 n=1 Tax=Caerostris darwini TaxID=1538125 RepID=A0AAV4S1A0_9ARAC|nr:protein TANC2 [Caerostris darwini]